MTQGLYVHDLDRCIGCAACVVACNNSNPVGEGLSWRTVHTFNRQRHPSAPVFHYSLACNHCSKPACLLLCPAGAYDKDPETGAVLVDRKRCMGCRYCSWVCPYSAPRYNSQAGVMEKCTFCQDRLEEGREPACVTACPVDALSFEARAEYEAVGRPGFPDTGLEPSLRIVGRRRNTTPEMAVTSSPQPPRVAVIDCSGLRSEWSLWFFTMVATWLVAWFAGSAVTGRGVVLPVFAAAGILGMAVSALHLGRATRMWRAVSNLRRSWISREVFFFGLFFVGACVLELGFAGQGRATWVIVACGWAALFSMDMVYRVPGQAIGAVPHSAMTTLTAALYLGIVVGAPYLVWTVAALKLVLFVARGGMGRPGRWELGLLRIVAGLLVPAAAMAPQLAIAPAFALVSATIGEAVDRARFYATLRFLTPEVQIGRDLGSSRMKQ